MKESFKSGFISIVGRPNVGKSTLMNTIIGEKLSIVSNKPQTTRNKIRGILTGENYQAVFLDTPGIQNPNSRLGDFMLNTALNTLNEVDLVLYLVEPEAKILAGERAIIERLAAVKTPIFLIINKSDKADENSIEKALEKFKLESPFEYADCLSISAIEGRNVSVLLEKIREILPEGPQYFPSDSFTDMPERHLVAELIREKALELLEDELPHGTAVEIERMRSRENKDLVDINAIIYCEKDSHKGMIIGKDGKMLKEIGSRARADITSLLGSPVNLQLWVKIKKNWRDNEMMLRNLGYNERNEI